MTNTQNMTPTERHALIAKLAETYGGAPYRWPRDACAILCDPTTGAVVLSPDEEALCQEARALDAVLDTAHEHSEAPTDVARLQALILRQTLETSGGVAADTVALDVVMPPPSARFDTVSWRHGAALAAALLLGVFAGSSGLVGDVPSPWSDQQTAVALIDVDDILSDDEDLL